MVTVEVNVSLEKILCAMRKLLLALSLLVIVIFVVVMVIVVIIFIAAVCRVADCRRCCRCSCSCSSRPTLDTSTVVWLH